MIDRIKEIIKKSGLSNADFSDRIGVQKSSLSHVLSERNKPSLDFVLKILEALPEINSDWLLFGKSSLASQKLPSETSVSLDEISPLEKAIKPNLSSKNISSDHEGIIQNPKSSVSVDKIVIFYKNGSFEVWDGQ
jgi:transcriptional regulator with XRE-family HTH domain